MKHIGILAALMLALCGTAGAQAYPDKSKPIRIVVPFGAGSATDLVARSISRALEETAEIRAVVENKPGAEGIIGMQSVKSSPADGYTMVLANISTQVLNRLMVPDATTYDPVADFVPISGISKFSLVLNASEGVRFENAADFIEAAKKSPGKYRYGSATTMTRLAMGMFEHMAGVELMQVPYKTMAAATTAMVSGEVDLVMNDAATATSFYSSGRVHPLAVTGASRMSGLPEVPTLRELGLPDYELEGWTAMYFPRGVQPSQVETMRGILQKALRSEFVLDALKKASHEPLAISGPEVAALQKSDSARLEKVVKATNQKAR